MSSAFAVMDPNSSYWQEKLGSVASGLVQSMGVDAVYMDQISASHCESCFEGGRGGGGSSWSSGNRAVLAAAAKAGKTAKGGTPIALSSESMNEQYIGQIGVNLALSVFNPSEMTDGHGNCGEVPAYASIYGGYTINMGDNRFPWDSRAVREHEDWIPQQRGMVAQQFVFGHAMGWMALMELDQWFTNASFAPDIAFFGTLARLRMASTKYLVHGSAYRPVQISPHGATTTIPAIQICDWGDAFSAGTPKCCNHNVVMASAWATTTGEIAIAVVNHGTETITVELALQLPVEHASARLVARPMVVGDDDEAVAPCGVTVGQGRVARMVKTLPGRSANVFEFQAHLGA
jgi:hypothetical protein